MSHFKLVCGNAHAVLASMETASVQSVVTSPPYWGLRDYGTAKWDGGDEDCDHIRQPNRLMDMGRDREASNGTFHGAKDPHQMREQFANTCDKCGAVRIDSQLGLERTPEEYVSRLVEVFREVRRVLKDDGVLWLNLGDSYATGAGKVGNCPGGGAQGERWSGDRGANPTTSKRGTNIGPISQPNRMPLPGLKPKDLIGIPWRVAFALQADGWYLRSDIIWSKANPMPESVRDRPTKAHEYLFLLAKQERYFYDADAIREPKKPDGFVCMSNPLGRNKRSVWTIATEPYHEAHFATFPKALVEPCILAGSRPGDTILDPFCGSGTVGAVSLLLDRHFIGIDLSPEYLKMADRRLWNAGSPLFLNTAAQSHQPRPHGHIPGHNGELWPIVEPLEVLDHLPVELLPSGLRGARVGGPCCSGSNQQPLPERVGRGGTHHAK